MPGNENRRTELEREVPREGAFGLSDVVSCLRPCKENLSPNSCGLQPTGYGDFTYQKVESRLTAVLHCPKNYDLETKRLSTLSPCNKVPDSARGSNLRFVSAGGSVCVPGGDFDGRTPHCGGDSRYVDGAKRG